MYLALIVVLAVALMNAVAQIILKTGLNSLDKFSMKELIGPKFFTIFFNPWIFGGLVFFGLSFVIWLYALSSFNVSFVFPLISLAYAFNAVLSMVFLKETIPPMRWMGILVIVAGCFLIIKS